MKNRKDIIVGLLILTGAVAMIAAAVAFRVPKDKDKRPQFDAAGAMQIIKRQLDLGARFIGSPGHERAVPLLVEELNGVASEIRVQEWEDGGVFLLPEDDGSSGAGIGGVPAAGQSEQQRDRQGAFDRHAGILPIRRGDATSAWRSR